MELEELKERIIDRYSVEELCEILDITVEDLVDRFSDLVYNSIRDLDIGIEYEELPEEDSPAYEHDEWRDR